MLAATSGPSGFGKRVEAEAGIEPANDGFANHCLTTWLLRLLPFAWGSGCYALLEGLSMPGFSVGLGDSLADGRSGVIQLLRAAAERGHEDEGVQNGPGQ